MIVLDSSYAMALTMPDEARPVTSTQVLAERLAAPFVWPLEIANAMRSNLRRGRLLPSGIDVLFTRLMALQVDVAAPAHVLPRRHFEAAQRHDLTPYDASYLALAEQLSATLATRDSALAAAAARVGIATHH